MRWRIAMGVLAFGLAVAIYFASQPKKGTVEWHRSEYLRINKVRVSVLWVDRRIVPHTVRSFYRRRLDRQSDLHLRALIKAGVLSESVVVISNSWPAKVLAEAEIELPKDIIEFTTISWGQGQINLIAPTDWIEKLGQAIRQADVPSTK